MAAITVPVVACLRIRNQVDYGEVPIKAFKGIILIETA